MLDVYVLLLIALTALLMGVGFVYSSPFGLWLGMAKMHRDIEIQAMIKAIARVSTIFIPVLLGVALSRATVNSWTDLITAFVLMLWLALWLFFQRMPAAYLEIARKEPIAISARRLVLQLMVIGGTFYFCLFVMWARSPYAGFILLALVFFLDLLLQLALIWLMLQQRRIQAT